MRFLLRTLKRPLIAISLILSFPVYSQTTPIDISGNYICSGNDVSDNSQYTVELSVTKSGDAYHYKGVEKGINNKKRSYLGTVLFAKNLNNVFASEFWQEDDPSKSGVIISQIQPDGGWESVWRWKDKTGINSETCKKN
jgi:hypothetical protein